MSIEFVPEKSFSEYLSETRKKKNFSVRALSRLSGVSQASILSYEEGTAQPDIINSVNLAYALGVSLKEFIFHLEETEDVIVCYDIDNNEQFLIPQYKFYDIEQENHFCVLFNKKIFLFKSEPFEGCLVYLLKDLNTNELKISRTEEQGFNTIGYLVREITNKNE